MHSQQHSQKSAILLVVFTLMAILWRVLGPDLGLPANFSPTMALALAVGLWFAPTTGLLIILGMVIAADIFLNLRYGAEIITWFTVMSLACYAAVWWLGRLLGPNASWPTMLGGGITASLLFYLASNTLSWLGNPLYQQTLAGWVQALTTGLPGYPPTWMFFTNSLAGDIFFLIFFRLLRAVIIGQDKRECTPVSDHA